MKANVAKLGWFCALALLASPAPVLAVPASAPPANDANQTSTATNPQPAVRFSPGVDDVVKMVDAGVDEGIIKTYIQNAPIAYALTSSDIIALQKDGIPSGLILAMLLRGGELRARPASAQPMVQAPAAQPAPAVSYFAPVVSDSYPAQTGYPAYPYAYPYDYTYPGNEVYPSSSYVSVGFGWGWPCYGTGWGWPGYGYRHGWPSYRGYGSYGYRYGGAWGGSHYSGPYRSPAPYHSGYAGHVGYGSHPSGNAGRVGYGSRPSPSGYAGRGGYGSSRASGSFHSAGGGGASHRGR